MPNDFDQGLRLDKDRTNIALGYNEGIDPICAAIAPDIPCPSSSKYPKFARGAWLCQEDTEIAWDARGVPEFLWPVEDWIDYVIGLHARKGFVSYEKQKSSGYVQGMVYSDPTAATKGVKKWLNQAWCYKVASVVTATSNKASPGTKWDAAGASPFDDLQAWVGAFVDQCGVTPGGLIIPIQALWHLGEGARAKYSHTGNMSNYEIVSTNVMQDLGIDTLYVSKANSWDGSSAFSPLWGKNVILFRSAKKPNDFEPSYMGNLIPEDKKKIEVLVPYDNADHTGRYVQVKWRYLVKELDANAVFMGEAVIN